MTTGEFNLINTCFLSSSNRKDVVLGIGDDCAIVSVPEDKQLAMTTDTLIDGVHFPSGTSPEDIACKTIAVNLSDLAAIGAEPAWFFLNLSLPDEATDWLDEFAGGMGDLDVRRAAAVEAAAARNPMGRITTPEDVADALTVLATPRTHWMTGNIIGVDGGEVMGSRESAEIP